MRDMSVKGIMVENSFAEAFDMRATALIITADSAEWARQAATAMTGFATSVIGCGVEGGIDRELAGTETPDGRPGVRVLLFAVSTSELQKQVLTRVGQCVLTSVGSACYGAIESDDKLKLGAALRYFGDGWQISKKFGGRHYWRIPVMDGEFVCEATIGMTKAAVGGGNLIIMGAHPRNVLKAAEAAARRIDAAHDVIMPFPGGIVRSGSKVGSKYKTLVASTNDAYCPTLKGAAKSKLGAEIGCVLEIVIDGLSAEAVGGAMRAGIAAIIRLGPEKGALRVSAGNYGGKLGRHHFHLRELLP